MKRDHLFSCGVWEPLENLVCGPIFCESSGRGKVRLEFLILPRPANHPLRDKSRMQTYMYLRNVSLFQPLVTSGLGLKKKKKKVDS